MPSLANQRLIIQGLERKTASNRRRLIEAFRSVDPPTDSALVGVGTVLITADVAPGIGAVTGLLFRDGSPEKRRHQMVKVFLEAPQILRSLRRLFG